MIKNKLSITLNKSLDESIKNYALINKISKSQLIEDILSKWINEQKQEKLISGYIEMANENLNLARDYEKLNDEAWTNE